MSRRLSPLVLLLTLLLGSSGGHAADQQRPTDWIKPGEHKGQKILIAVYYWEGGNLDSVPMNYVPPVLRQMGFTVDVLKAPPHLPSLDGYDQTWIVSGSGSTFNDEDVEKLRAFMKRGKGVYVMADNSPYVHEANVIGRALHGINIQGGYYGGQTVNVVAPGVVKKMVEEAMKKGDMEKLSELRRAGFLNGKLYAEDHELLTGIQQIYEGITIASMSPSKDLDVILRASDNQSLVAVSKKPGERMIYDGGFTRLYCGWDQHAAINAQWYRNVAAYLSGKRRADLPQG